MPDRVHRAVSGAARRLRSDQGSVSVEMTALVFPITVLALIVIVGVWRMMASDLDVQAAASAAARAASLQDNPAAAIDAARQAAAADLDTRRHTCAALTIDVDTTRFAPGGAVSVTLACTVATNDLSILKAVGGATTRASATAPLEQFREVNQ
jgi:Flp pilus assembly protein TadG